MPKKMSEPLKVRSVSNNKNLEFVYEFDKAVKKYGIVKYVETLGWNGGDFKAVLLNEKGSPIVDKEVWEVVEKALVEHRKNKFKK